MVCGASGRIEATDPLRRKFTHKGTWHITVPAW